MGPGCEQIPEGKAQDEKNRTDPDDTIKDTTEMNPETPTSPTTSMATLRYRWSKTVPTSSPEVIFIQSDRENEPIKLTWTESSDCFYSSEMALPCGNFSGKLVVGGTDYPVEDLLIKHYTFEADLFIREDIIEDEVGINETLMEEEKEEQDPPLNTIDTYQDINTSFAIHPKMDSTNSGIHVSNKYQKLVRQQIYEKMTEVEPTEKTGRRTPIGDISIEPFFDKFQTPQSSESLHGSLGQALQIEGIQNPVMEIPDHMTQNITLENEVNGFFYDDINQMPSSSLVQEGRVDTMANVLGREGRRTPLSTVDPMSEVIVDVLETRLSPKNEIVGDILESGARQSSPAQSDHSYSVHGLDRQTLQQSPHSNHSSVRSTPHKDFITDSFHSSQEKLYPQDKHRLSGNDHGSSLTNGDYHTYSDNMDDRPQSLSSEQELMQYFDQGSRGMSEQRSEQQRMPAVGSTLQPITMQTFHSTERPSSTISLPVITTRQRLQAEKRIMTPDNRIRVPITASPLLRGAGESSIHVRPASVTSALSLASSRSVTPIAAHAVLKNGYEEENAHRLRDLEDTVTNLRKLLSAREIEVHELMDQLKDVRGINQALRTEVGHIQDLKAESFRIDGMQEQLQTKYTQALNEKDILAAEVVKLQDELRGFLGVPSSRERRLSGRSDDSMALNSFNPNSPTALQRKIDDLESHVQDLLEANESAVFSLTDAEQTIQGLQTEKQAFFGEQANRQKIEEENTCLREQMLDLKKRINYGHKDSEHRKEIELQQLHEDYRGLRDRNFQLHEGNMKLKEEMRELRRALERTTRTDVQYRDETRPKTPDPHTRNEGEHPYDSSYHMERNQRNTRTSSESLPGEAKHSRDSNYNVQLSTDKIARLENKKLEWGFTEPISVGSYIKKIQRSVPDGSNNEKEQRAEKSSSRYDHTGTPDRKCYEQTTSAAIARERTSYDSVLSPGRNKHDPVPYTPKRSASYERKYEHYSPLERSYDYSSQERRLHSSPNSLHQKRFEHSHSSYRSSLLRTNSEKMGLDQISPSDGHVIDNRQRRMSADREYQSLNTSHLEQDKPRSSPSLGRSKERRDSASSEKSDSTLVLMSGYNSLPPTSVPLKQLIYHDSEENRGMHRIYHDSVDDRSKHRVYQDMEDIRAYPGYESSHTISDDIDDNSDTATDILVNAQVSPIEMSKSQAPCRLYRRDSIGSASEVSMSSYSDIDEQLIANMRKRSKSADGREFIGRRNPAGTHDQTSLRGMVPKSMPTSPSGLRSITPRPLATQHNMGSLSASCGSLQSLTQGMKPFAPRAPGDIEVSDVVKFSRQGGKLSQGTVKFIGHLPGRSDMYLGVQLDKDDGKHDGTFEGIRYFNCKPNKGVFVAFNKVVMAWSPY